MKEENKRKGIIYLTIGVVTLLVLVAGAAYAYFQAQVGDGTSFDVNATTGTTDVLSFLMSDINVTEDNPNIEDNNNRDSENENAEIVINASQDNFGENDKSLGDGVSARAILKANNTASATYNVFFVMDANDLIYTQGTKYPELILTVIGPDDKEVTNIDGLNYHNADESNPNDVSGFDITGKTNGFAIKKGQEIEVEESNSNHQTEQEWKIKVTLVNLKGNQNENTKKEINGEVVITQEEIETYKLNKIKNVKVDNKTTSSITTTLELEDKPTNEAIEYYFAKEEKGRVSTIAIEELVWEKELTPTHTFTDLKSDTNYIIYSYVVDSEGFRSNTYKTELIATNKTLPEITKLEVTNKSYNEISIEIESEEGDRGIKEYEYEISGATIEELRIEKDTLKTHTFKNLSEQQQYTIKVRAVDNDGDKSTDSTKEVETLKKTIGLVCKGQEMASCIKENYELDESIIYHNLEDATKKQFANYELVADDNSYRYTGGNDIVHNYVCLDGESINGECLSDRDLYRIIGIFKNDETQNYEMKLVTSYMANIKETGNVEAFSTMYDTYSVYFWNSSNGVNKEDINNNMWRYSNLNNKNLNETFLNFLKSKVKNIPITDHVWFTGGIINSNENAYNVFRYELGNERVKINEQYCYEVNDNKTLIACTKDDLFHKAKIGLPYLSDYGYSAFSEGWDKLVASTYNTFKENNWLVMSGTWTMTRKRNANKIYHVYTSGRSDEGYAVYVVSGITPTFYISTDTKLSSGEGTISNPYRLSM